MKKKFLYTIVAVIVSVLVLVVPAIHPAGRHGRRAGVNKSSLCAMRQYLALNPATVSAQELEQKKQAAYNAAATMPNRLRMKQQEQFAHKDAQSQHKALVQLAAITGQTADQLRTQAGRERAQAEVQQLLTTLGNENNTIVKQIKDKLYDQISFNTVLARVEKAAAVIDAFGRVYSNDPAYAAFVTRLETILKPALVKNGLTFIAHTLKAACPHLSAQMNPSSTLMNTIRPHAIERLKKSGVLAIVNSMDMTNTQRYGNALTHARAASTQLYETMTMIIDKLGIVVEQSADKAVAAQYQRLYQSYVNAAEEFTTLVLPLQLICTGKTYQQVVPADTVKRTIAQYRNRLQVNQRNQRQTEREQIQHTPEDTANDQQDQEQEEEDKEDAQPKNTHTTRRDVIGAAGALGLILLYEFVIAPKMGTKKLGIAEFCKAALNKQNPFTTKLDGQQVGDNNDEQAKKNSPGFLKRFGFDILCSFLGL